MRKLLQFTLLTLLATLVSLTAMANEELLRFSDKGFTNQQEVTTVDATNFTVTFNKGTGSTPPRYYTSGYAIRAYGGNYFIVSSSYEITKIVITFGTSDGSNIITTDVGTYNNGYWEGSSKNVKFTIGGSSGNRRISEITVTYTPTSSNKVATPTFSPEDGTYTRAQDVTISTTTQDATIYYTLDGNNPTTSSNVYSSPIKIEETTTIKAIAVKEGMDNSNVGTATYIIPSETTYKKVTSNDDLTSGKYLIVYENDNIAFDGSLENLDKGNNTKGVTIEDNWIVTSKDIYNIYFTIDVNKGTIQNASGKFIGWNSNNNNGLAQSDISDLTNTISIDEDANAVIAANQTTNKVLRFNDASGENNYRFRYYNTNGTQKPIQLYKEVKGVELVKMNTKGFVTYVTKNAIDWEKTLAKNTQDETVDVHGYKVIQFTQESAVFGEFGVGENEKFIPAGTPIIIKGQAGLNELVIASTEDGIVAPSNNKLYASDGTVTATAENHLLVFQKTSVWTEEDPYNNYAFFKLKEGRNIPEGKAYLKGEDVSEEITATTNAAMGIFLLEDLGKPQDTGTTGITQYSALQNGSMTNGTVYDLSGRKIAESLQRMKGLAKGIYIVNGRKVVIK